MSYLLLFDDVAARPARSWPFVLSGLQGAPQLHCPCRHSNCALLGSYIMNTMEWMAKVVGHCPAPKLLLLPTNRLPYGLISRIINLSAATSNDGR